MLIRALLSLALLVCLQALGLAKTSTWTDLQGNSFKGEPSSLYGPFAIFKTESGGGRRVLLRTLSPDDCRRFHEAIAARPPLAPTWAKAQGSLSYDLVGRLVQVTNKKASPVDFSARPEPEFLILFFGSAWEGHSYVTTELFRAGYNRLRRVYGPLLEGAYLGVRQDEKGNINIATAISMPWPVAIYEQQSSIECFRNFAPAEGLRLMLVTRHGVPLVVSEAKDIQEVKRFLDDTAAILAAGDPLNPLFWADTAHYQAATRPLVFATTDAPALLIGNPLRAEALRRLKVTKVHAQLELGADGKVLSAKLSADSTVPADLTPKIEDSLVKGVVASPAISKGKLAAGTLDFLYEVPPANAALDTDRAWLLIANRKEIPIPSWLLLRPIPVPPELFSSVKDVDEQGVTRMTGFKVSAKEDERKKFEEAVSHKSQMNAFSSDFFSDAGASAVRPVEGLAQTVDDETYYWERVDSTDGFLDFRNNKTRDFCVGYAWTEFEVPSAGPAFMGIGSDDGVKIWLNGKLICDRWSRRTTKVDEDIVPMNLAAGKNQLLIKIQNASGDWSVISRIRR